MEIVFEDEFKAGDTLSITYEVTIPETAENGDVFEFHGEAGIDDQDPDAVVSGPNQITVETDEPEPDPANYQLSNLDPADAEVTEGDAPIDVSVDVENIGDETGDQDVELEITDGSDEVVYSDTVENVAIEGDSTETVTFADVTAGDLAAGDYTVTVTSADDSVSGTLSVAAAEPDPEPADYQLSNLDPADVVVTEGDDPIDVSVDMENVGGEEEEQAVVLEIFNETDDVVVTEHVFDAGIEPGVSETITFEAVPVGDLDAGAYTFEVGSLHDYVSGTITVEEAEPDLDPASYAVSTLDPADAEVTEGDAPIDVSVIVENLGGEAGDQTVELTITDAVGEDVYSDTAENVAVDGGATETVVFTNVTAGAFAAGNYTIEVSSDDDSITGTLTVSEAPDPADYQLSNLELTAVEVTEGDDPIDVSVDVENIGDETFEQDIELEITDASDEVIYNDTAANVVVDAGATETVTFEGVPVGDIDVGNYTVHVSSDDDSIAGTLTVEEDDDDPFLSDGQPGFGPVAALIALLGAMLLARRRV